MRDHHRQTLDRFIRSVQDQPDVRAVILGGSIAKDLAREDSDVDVMVVVEPGPWRRRYEEFRLAEVLTQFADYPGGYVDAKFIDRAFLEAAAERGSEPTRDSFRGATVIWTREDGLRPLLDRIPVYPESERAGKLESFYAQVRVQSFFLGEAAKREDSFLMAHACTTAALFAGRLLLADARVLFPSNKRLMERVATLPALPEGFLEAVRAATTTPSREAGQRLIDVVVGWKEWGIDYARALGRYVAESELNWLEHPPCPAER